MIALEPHAFASVEMGDGRAHFTFDRVGVPAGSVESRRGVPAHASHIVAKFTRVLAACPRIAGVDFAFGGEEVVDGTEITLFGEGYHHVVVIEADFRRLFVPGAVIK